MLKIVILLASLLLIAAPSINGILPEIRDYLGITQTQSELLITLPNIVKMFATILSNSLINRIGMKKTVIVGLIVIGIGGVMPVFLASGYFYILLSRFIFGAGVGIMSTSAVIYIRILFDEHECATLMGYRSSIEMLGQSILALIIGALAVIRWNISFLAYGIAFVIAIMFAIVVPEAKNESSQNKDMYKNDIEKMSPLVYPIALFVCLMIMSASMITIRFPAMATEIMGDGYNSSIFVALKPIIGIIAAFFFGKLSHLLGRKLLYLGMINLIVSVFMMAFAGQNFVVLVIGFLLSSVVLGWIIPFVFNAIARISTEKNQQIAMTFVLSGGNIGVFIMPFIVQLLEIILRNDALSAPYPILGIVLCMTLIAVLMVEKSKYFKKA